MFDELINSIHNSRKLAGSKKPFVVAVSGFGGSGKSTLAAQLQAALTRAEIVSIDCFVKNRLAGRSADWDDFDRERFRNEVLSPSLNGQTVVYGVYDWTTDAVGSQKTLPEHDILIVEGCSLLAPELRAYYDYSIWVDVELEEATQLGIARDRAQSADWPEKWFEVWMPNERDFFEKYRPDLVADFVYRWQG